MYIEYEKELTELYVKMVKAEAFAKKLPIFKDIILDKKLTGLEDRSGYINKYKELPLGWGVNRTNYSHPDC